MPVADVLGPRRGGMSLGGSSNFPAVSGYNCNLYSPCGGIAASDWRTSVHVPRSLQGAVPFCQPGRRLSIAFRGLGVIKLLWAVTGKKDEERRQARSTVLYIGFGDIFGCFRERWGRREGAGRGGSSRSGYV